MLDHEMYDILIQNLEDILRSSIHGDVIVSKDDYNIYVTIFNRGEWNYRIENVDLKKPWELNSMELAIEIIKKHRRKVNFAFFK